MNRLLIICHLLTAMLTATAGGHNPVLPAMQKIEYGDGSLLVKGLFIGFAMIPCDEDQFAASELARVFPKATSSPISVKGFAVDVSVMLERTGSSAPLPVSDENPGPNSRESYRIKITPKCVRVSAKSSAGLFYAVQTLRQMIEGTADEATLPEAEIEDGPVLAYRGFMMDMSHFQFPRIEEIKSQIDFLSRLKANQYLFYSECSIELDGYPLLMADARYTKKEVKELIEYARQRHIDVIPNMDLYGHLYDLFRLERYSDMAVISHGGEFSPDNPRVVPLLKNWISQISSLFPSPFFHIGFDETWLLEVEAEKRGISPEELYLNMLERTTNLAKKQGKTPLFWADMLQKYPSMIPKTPKGTIAVPWHYRAFDSLQYEKLLSDFPKSDVPMIVQGAILNWNWVVPNYERSILNTDVLIKAGLMYGAIGYYNSGWTDTPLTLMRMGYPDMAYGSVVSWQGEGTQYGHFFKAYAQASHPAAVSEYFADALISMYRSESLIREVIGTHNPVFWGNPFTAGALKKVKANMEGFKEGRLAAEDAQEYIREALKFGGDTTQLTTMLAEVKMLDYPIREGGTLLGLETLTEGLK